MNRTPITGIGLMCGTSHDGLDIAHCSFQEQKGRWSFICNRTQEVPLPSPLKSKLSKATQMSNKELNTLDAEVGEFFASSVKRFQKANPLPTDFIASHGITVFHQPDKGITLQIGSGKIIAENTGITTINDFRSEDVSKGGQGAPLVPYPDSILFSEYEATLNLGGFANVAILDPNHLSGFDISPCNKILNQLAQEYDGSEFDQNGSMAKSGSIHVELFDQLNDLQFYKLDPPKSLGHEWYIEHFLPLFNQEILVFDRMRTVVEHISQQIGCMLPNHGRTLCTGGGSYNSFLIDRIQYYSKCEIIIPKPDLINFKEAIDFAFLGALRILNKKNIDRRVTGAKSNSTSGILFLP